MLYALGIEIEIFLQHLGEFRESFLPLRKEKLVLRLEDLGSGHNKAFMAH